MKKVFRLGNSFTMTPLGRRDIIASVIVVAILGFLAFAYVRKIGRPKVVRFCENNLKNMGLAFDIFAGDNDGHFPMEVSTNEGGTKELQDGRYLFRHFQAVSIELGEPRILVCPKDKRTPAASFEALANSNISYFLNIDASQKTTNVVLAGDRNLTNGKPLVKSLLILRSHDRLEWTKGLHYKSARKGVGNVIFSDGRHERLGGAELQKLLPATNDFQRLAMPPP